jgi:hypothetical protein
VCYKRLRLSALKSMKNSSILCFSLKMGALNSTGLLGSFGLAASGACYRSSLSAPDC